jgi:autotransporter-associated beta strand protein
VFSGAISGSGGLVKNGSGTLVLTGANSYSGGTTVSGGTLVGTTTSLRGDIANNSLVVLDQSFDGSFDADMTGSGVLEKSGSGTVTVGGSIAHTGGTFVRGGRLIGTASSLRGTILNDSAVVFGGNQSGAFSGLLAGNGTFEKTGGGTLTLTGDHVHSGLFNVDAGVLSLDGTLASRITVGPNATLRALGTIFGATTIDGLLVVPNGGSSTVASLKDESSGDALTSAPLLTFADDLTLNPGSRLSMPVGPGPNPTVLVGGTATLSGAELELTPAAPLTERATSFLALAAIEGLNMTSTTGTTTAPDVVPYLKQDDNLLFVTLLNLGIPLSNDVNNPNAKSVGDAIERLKDNPTEDQLAFIRELTGLTDEELEGALRQVSGEAHATFLQIGIRDSEAANDQIRREVMARRREARGTDNLGASWWGQMGGERTRLTNASGDRIGTIDLGSGMGGVDYRATETVTFGGGAGLSGGTIGLIDLNSSGDILSPRAFGYAGWRPKSFGFKGGATFARQKMKGQRQLDFQARLPDELGGDPIGEGIHRRAESEEVTLIKDQWTDWDDEHEINTYTISYVFGYRRATFTRRGFIESGADSLSLEMPEQTVTLKQVNTLFNFWRREGDFRPFGEFLYRREMTDGRTTTVLEFPDDGDSRFFVDGEPAPKNITKIRLGSTWFLQSSTWRFEYEYRHATGQTTHGGALHVRF